ncbi:MAG: tetratricopeptide repeat protein [Trichormus sp. ATA11-4-KO1]|jgi:serine/threonine protein kinase/Flp pilus assembly protein TadD|nr:tetratricopeptide repeat protein [Trichormus sp. ATA11-4-KO1]
MSCYCINPLCEQRQNPDDAEICLSCGTSLFINNRIRLLKPLRELSENPFTYNEIFEVEDIGTQHNPEHKRRVMKVMKWSSAKFVQRIEREVLALQLINHPNIPKTNGEDDFFVFTPNQSPFKLRCLVMDKFEGQNLEEWIKFHEPISQSVALDWLRQLVEILDIVHHTEFFHRDIKPGNIILQPDGRLALIDFGAVRRITDTYLAKVSASGGTDTRVGKYEITSVISHYYSPLEQIYGKAVPQSDFYALGRTFVRLVTGVSLMELPTNRDTTSLIWRDKAPQIDKPLADFIDELMAPMPGNRPANTEIILQRLKKIPQQSKIYKITRSKKFIFSVVIASASLIGLGIYKIGLPAFANHLVVKGQELEAANDSENAQKYFNQAIEYNSQLKLSVSQFYLEQAARYFNNFRLAKKYYELALKYNDKDINVYHSLAVVCWQLGDFRCAIDNYQKILKLSPNDWEGYYRLGSFYDDEGRNDLAEEQYKIALKINNKAIPALNNLSRLSNLKEDYAQATALALKGLRLTEDQQLQAALYKNLGWAKFIQNQYNDAEKYLQKASDLDSQRIDAVCLLAQVQEALGKNEDARLSWEICMLARTTQQDVFKWRQGLLDRLTNNSKISK